MSVSHLICLGSALGIVACRPETPPRSPDQIAPAEAPLQEPVRLQPFHVRAVQDPASTERIAIDGYDATMLFNRGQAAYKRGDFKNAAEIYHQLYLEFPESELAPPALYNRALSRERLGDWAGAVEDYETLTEKYPGFRDVKDARFRMAGAYESLEAYAETVEILNTLLYHQPDLEGIERVEALARKGAALIQLGRPEEAREVLKEAILLFRAGRDLSASASTYHVAMAHFKLGEIVEGEMRAVRLPSDEARLQPALEKKCRLLLDAQHEYTRAIRVGDPHFAAAAAYRIGQLFRALWADMLAAPPPKNLNEEEREIYLEVLKKRTRVLLQKAIVQWERVLKMADRLNLSNEWVDRTRKDLREIRSILVQQDFPSLPSR